MNFKINVAKPSLGEEELSEIKKVLDSRWIGLGEKVNEFETRLKDFLGIKNVVCVNSGTAAIYLSLKAYVSAGDEVIVPSLTNPAPVQAIIACGAKPVFCDVDADTINMDLKDAEKKISDKTKAIIPIHYNGIPNDMGRIMSIAKKYNVKVIEDAAHGFGSIYNGTKLGKFGDVGCFSFDPIKHITSIEGGAVATGDDKSADLIRKMRDLGISNNPSERYDDGHYSVVTSGLRFGMSNVNAAVGIVQLGKLDSFIEKRMEIIQSYDESFKDVKEIELLRINYKETAPAFYIVKAKKRDLLRKFLADKGIQTRIYFVPNHIQPFFKKFASELPVTEKVWQELIALPLYCDMNRYERDYVINSVKEFYIQ